MFGFKNKADVFGDLEEPILMELDRYFEDGENELVYVATSEDEGINRFFEERGECTGRVGTSPDKRFMYLPDLVEQLSEEDVLRYRAPYGSGEQKGMRIGNDYMLQFFSPKSQKLMKRLGRGFLWLKVQEDTWEHDTSERYSNIYEFFPLVSDSEKPIRTQLQDILRLMWAEERAECEYDFLECWETDRFRTSDFADYEFNSQEEGEDIDDLMEEIRAKVKRLRQRGISELILEQLIHPEEKLSKLVITKNYRLFLPDYQNMEIKMEPLVKSVYFLFLKHPEGILFKHLPDYRAELMEIYLKLKPNGLTERVRKSIEDVTNPLLNSINEKCARIRGAFVGQFDNCLARHYYIDGRRAEPKKIALSRELVVWEE